MCRKRWIQINLIHKARELYNNGLPVFDLRGWARRNKFKKMKIYLRVGTERICIYVGWVKSSVAESVRRADKVRYGDN